ncbi:MAG TPA: V-type ATP synthase subunit E family protein [Solirubrobacteraceae bacterium]|nr:V-type ATP synthase subunit E family protein [Solirubrobacteraceae bacterium]
MTVAVARDALLADASERAAALLAAADAEARERVGRAQADADAVIARGRAQGEAEGRVQAARERALELAGARLDVLTAQRESCDELARRARAAALALRDEPGYEALLDRLADAARRELGDGARIERDPPQAGGVVATAGSRRADLSLPILAERCVEALGLGLRRLWS